MISEETLAGTKILNELLSEINAEIGGAVRLAANEPLVDSCSKLEYKLCNDDDESGRALFVLFEQVTTDRSLRAEAKLNLKQSILTFWDKRNEILRDTVSIDY